MELQGNGQQSEKMEVKSRVPNPGNEEKRKGCERNKGLSIKYGSNSIHTKWVPHDEKKESEKNTDTYSKIMLKTDLEGGGRV